MKFPIHENLSSSGTKTSATDDEEEVVEENSIASTSGADNKTMDVLADWCGAIMVVECFFFSNATSLLLPKLTIN
jgi:preprotein translocase subunit SecD